MACSCSSSSTAGAFFTTEARRYARQFKKRGLAREQKLLIDGICRRPVDGISIMEIGCGVGGLHLTLLQRGAHQVTGIDIAEGMIEAAKLLSQDLGFTGRTRYRVGDAVQLAGEEPAADLVLMDKVVCCYEDLPALLDAAAGKARTTLAISFPRPTPLVTHAMKFIIRMRKLLRRTFIPSLHDWQAMVRDIERRGFRERDRSHTFIWSVAIFERIQNAPREAA